MTDRDAAAAEQAGLRVLAHVIHQAAPDLFDAAGDHTDPLTIARAVRAAGWHTDDDRTRIDDLIEASSLGTFEAKAGRESVPRDVGIAIVKAAEHMARADLAETKVAAVAALADRWERENPVAEDEPWNPRTAERTAMLRAVLALRAVIADPELALAEVRAQALEDAAHPAVFPGDVLTQAWLQERADRTRRGER